MKWIITYACLVPITAYGQSVKKYPAELTTFSPLDPYASYIDEAYVGYDEAMAGWSIAAQFDLSDIPKEATIEVAFFALDCNVKTETTSFELHAIVAPWIASATTYNAQPKINELPFKIGTINQSGFAAIQITELAQSWINTNDNFGVLIRPIIGPMRECFADEPPKITFFYTLNDPCDDVSCEEGYICDEGTCAKQCTCTDGECCDGCYFKKNVICGSTPASTIYDCFGTLCGATLKAQNGYHYCDGMHTDCPDSLTWNNEWYVVEQCSNAQICETNSNAAGYCINYPLCCQPQCEEKECGDDGCGDVCGTCAEGYACFQETCIRPQEPCTPCSQQSDCADDSLCLWYKGYPEAGGICCKKGCATDDDCPLDHQCVEVQGKTACFVMEKGTICKKNKVFTTNTCDIAYKEQENCVLNNMVCFEDACCEPSCDNKECGNDGCGGTCSSCDIGQTCVQYVCRECIPGSIDAEMCNEPCTTHIRVCNIHGAWSTWTHCQKNEPCDEHMHAALQCVDAECIAGEHYESPCGTCGTYITICDELCMFEDGKCVDPCSTKSTNTTPKTDSRKSEKEAPLSHTLPRDPQPETHSGCTNETSMRKTANPFVYFMMLILLIHAYTRRT